MSSYVDLFNESTLSGQIASVDELTVITNASVGGTLTLGGLAPSSVLQLNASSQVTATPLAPAKLLGTDDAGGLKALTPTSNNGCLVTRVGSNVYFDTPQNLTPADGPAFSFLVILPPGSSESLMQFSTVGGVTSLQRDDGIGFSITNLPTAPTLVDDLVVHGLTAGMPMKTDANQKLVSAAIDLTTDITGILPVASGGTGSGTALANNCIIVSAAGALTESAAMTDGQVLLGSTGAAPVVASILGTANRVTVVPGPGTLQLTGPQDLGLTSVPQFGGLTATGSISCTSVTCNSATVGSLSCSSMQCSGTASVSGAMTVGALTSTSITNSGTSSFTGAMSVGTLTSTSITNSGTSSFTGAMSVGPVTSTSITNSGTSSFTGAMTVGALTSTSITNSGTSSFTGAMSVGTLTSTSITNAGTSSFTGAMSVGALTSTSITNAGTSSFTGAMSVGALTSTGAISCSSVVNSGTASSVRETLSATSNQLVLGTTHTTTINAAAPASSSVITIPSPVLTTSEFMLTTGALQTIVGGKQFTGAAIFNDITLATTGGTASLLGHYEETTHTTTLVGPWTTNPSITFNITRIGRLVQAQATADYGGTFSAAAFVTLTTPFPARFRPSCLVRAYTIVQNNSVIIQTHWDLATSGNITIFGDALGGQFSSGTCKVFAPNASWSV